jgi:hypothetical protein
VRRFEFVVAVVLAAAGVRSAIHHARRPFASDDVRDQLLYAAYLTGRVGMWFAFAGLFVILAFAGASDPTPDPVTGKLDVVEASDYAWYVLVFAVLGAMQLLAGWFLGHRGDGSRGDDGGGLSRRP